ncbi:MAG: hypothetical protein M3220_13935, partial [Chloroflexota bacterium]|nr:hypothetical protein [Chloroflexota bacterium]
DMTDTILNAYATGRGRIVVQAKTHVEEMSRNRRRIVITELPFQTNKSNLIEKIADLARDGKVDGITDLRDESDRRGMRIVIELTRNVNPPDVLGALFKYTPLRQTFGVIMLALVDGQPRMLSLKRALQLFVEHRQDVIRRRSQYDLERARAREHILEGLLIALDNLDEVIDTIRRSRRVDTAHRNLMRKFNLTQKQAQAVLDMRLARLAALERKKIEEEYQDVQAEIEYLEGLLGDPAKVLGVIREELKALKERYNDPRRSLIITESEYTGNVVQADQLIPDGEVLVTITERGEIQRIMNVARKPRSGRGYTQIVTANNRHELLLITKNGRAWRTPVYQLPEKTGRSNGERLAQLLSGWDRGEAVAVALDVPSDDDVLSQGYLLVVTRSGRVVRVSASEVKNLHSGTLLVNLEEGDEVLWAGFSLGADNVVLVSAQGQAIQFSELDVRATGIGVQGVWGMKLEEKDDTVVGAGLAWQGDHVVVISERGAYKRTPLAEYPTQGRYGKGVRAMNLDEETGPLAAATIARKGDRLSFHTNKRKTFNTQVRHVPRLDRYQQGTLVADMPSSERITEVLKWEDVSAWPNGSSGTESASQETESTEQAESASSGRKKTRKGSAGKKSKKRNAKKNSKRDNGQQLSLDLAGSNGRSASSQGRKAKKEG